MAVQQLNFLGINRAVSDYGGPGACEELINLRPTTQGLVPVKPFSVKWSGLTYKKVITHNTSTGANYLCFKKVAEDDHYKCQVWQIDSHGDIIGVSPLTDFYIEGDAAIEDIHYATAGNIITFSAKEPDNSYYKNASLLWDGSQYKVIEANIPDITPTLTPGTPELKFSTIEQTFTETSTKNEITSFLESAFNEIQESNKTYCFGPVLIALAFKTNDGNTFWTSKWIAYDPIQEIDEVLDPGASTPVYYHYMYGDFTNPTQDITDFFNRHDDAYLVTQGGAGAQHAQVGGVTLSLTLPQISSWNEDTSVIKSVEVYATRPQLHLTPEDMLSRSNNALLYLPAVLLKDMELGSQLFYLQESVPLKELKLGSKTIQLKFGGNIQTTNKTLEVDAGAVVRYGDIVSYNARFHYFDSTAEVSIGMPWFGGYTSGGTTYTSDIFVVFNDGQRDTMCYAGQTSLPGDRRPQLVTCPDVRVKEVIAQIPYSSSPNTNYTILRYEMMESSRYNYSYATTDNVHISYSATAKYTPSDYRTFVRIEESNAINVTEQYNPFVFRVEHSYLAPGKVLDVQPQMVAVQDVSFGDYPLNVFTDRGVYALLQGSGTVLYGNFRSVSNLVSGSNSIPTENGTFFIASGNLWLIAGSKAVLVSDALSLGPHKFIRSNTGYKSLSNEAYDVEDLESDPIFEVYVNGNGTTIPGAKLCYNRFRDEIYVSNAKYDYTYALSLKYRQWFKIGISMAQDVPGSTIVSTKGSTTGTTDILDFTDEKENTSVLVHLQSRPFSFGYMYSHVHRIVSMVRAALSSSDLLIAAVYGSDDLQEWYLLSYAGRSSESETSKLKVSQLRTPPAARSWRYYTVCIGGTTPSDTDFGPVVVDYEPVIRRIG